MDKHIKTDTAPRRISNAEYIRQMNNEQLKDFIERLEYRDEKPWDIEFSSQYCDTCKTEACSLSGVCPVGVKDVIAWWLEQPNKDNMYLVEKTQLNHDFTCAEYDLCSLCVYEKSCSQEQMEKCGVNYDLFDYKRFSSSQ